MSEALVVVVAGGPPPLPASARDVPPDALVVAADAGLDHALALGLAVTIAIGDFDSASAEALATAEAAGTRIERHPAEKDATDLELALDAALELGATRVVVLASDGGRLDHLHSALVLLGSAKYAGVRLDAQVGRALVHVIRDERAIRGHSGELISLLALHGAAEGVRTEGLMYPLADETLGPGSSRGVSNVFAESEARVSVERGVVLAIRPGDDGGGAS